MIEGTSTLPTAMPSPAMTVPPYRAATPGSRRTRIPAATVSAISASAASVPMRRATIGATGEPSAMQTTGSVVSAPAAAAESGTSARISSSSGGTLATAVRRLSAVKTIAAASGQARRGAVRTTCSVEAAAREGGPQLRRRRGVDAFMRRFLPVLIALFALTGAHTASAASTEIGIADDRMLLPGGPTADQAVAEWRRLGVDNVR